ncbi:hypothetical protein EPI10_028651 [Gossypium australe]|uniref:RNA-directed DNA polymerase-like protein n=1 Tax=Gossypium australe TaxID=47621 RepID=A0A5B6UZZ5_9ROSI|nr:hypothetical protein EPI10_028651 [Gossypium australe]
MFSKIDLRSGYYQLRMCRKLHSEQVNESFGSEKLDSWDILFQRKAFELIRVKFQQLLTRNHQETYPKSEAFLD